MLLGQNMINEYTCLKTKIITAQLLFLQLFIFLALELCSFLLATSIGTNIQETSKTSTTKNITLNKRKALQERTKK